MKTWNIFLIKHFNISRQLLAYMVFMHTLTQSLPVRGKHTPTIILPHNQPCLKCFELLEANFNYLDSIQISTLAVYPCRNLADGINRTFPAAYGSTS